MGSRIDHVEVLSGELTISEEGKVWLAEAENGEHGTFPEIGPDIGDDSTLQLHWSGNRSASVFSDGTLADLLRLTSGKADFVVHWEGIMGVEGIRVVDGKMTRHHVEMKLGKEL